MYWAEHEQLLAQILEINEVKYIEFKPIAHKEVFWISFWCFACIKFLKKTTTVFGNSLQQCHYMGKTLPTWANFSLAILAILLPAVCLTVVAQNSGEEVLVFTMLKHRSCQFRFYPWLKLFCLMSFGAEQFKICSIFSLFPGIIHSKCQGESCLLFFFINFAYFSTIWSADSKRVQINLRPL